MPDGSHHHRIWKAGWTVVCPAVVYAFTIDPAIAGGFLLGYYLGKYIDPDWDQVSITSGEGRILRDFKLVGKVIVGYATVYGGIFAGHHRSFLSHFPFVSTAIRMVYLFWWLWFLPILWYDWQLILIIGVWLGLSIADLEHYLADKFFSNSNQKLR